MLLLAWALLAAVVPFVDAQSGEFLIRCAVMCLYLLSASAFSLIVFS